MSTKIAHNNLRENVLKGKTSEAFMKYEAVQKNIILCGNIKIYLGLKLRNCTKFKK